MLHLYVLTEIMVHLLDCTTLIMCESKDTKEKYKKQNDTWT